MKYPSPPKKIDDLLVRRNGSYKVNIIEGYPKSKCGPPSNRNTVLRGVFQCDNELCSVR